MAGLGILGENGLLINEKYGSYVFISEIITDLPVSEISERALCKISVCEGCGACKVACPTGKLLGNGECLSDLTQKRGEIDENTSKLMRKINTVWGCDECQRVCPHNFNKEKTPIADFYLDRIELLTTDDILNMSKAEFSTRAFSWRGKNTVLRNLKELGY